MGAIERHVRNPSSVMSKFIVITGASKGSVAPLPMLLQTTVGLLSVSRAAQPTISQGFSSKPISQTATGPRHLPPS
jgi:hypothetical protein